MAYNFAGMPTPGMPPMSIGPMGPLGPIAGPQSFMELTGQGFPPLPPPPSIPLPGMNDSPLEFSTNKNQPPSGRDNSEDSSFDRIRNDKNESRRDCGDNRDSNRDNRDNNRRRSDRNDRRDRERDRRDERNEKERREDRRLDDRVNLTSSNNSHSANSGSNTQMTSLNSQTLTTNSHSFTPQIETATTPSVWSMGVGYQVMGMGPMNPMSAMMSEIALGPHMGAPPHGYGPPISMGMIPHCDSTVLSAQMLGGPEQLHINDTTAQIISAGLPPSSATSMSPQQNSSLNTKDVIHCKSCILLPPNPNIPVPTTREKPPGCRTVFVGGLPENITETIIHEIFERCGEITTLRLSKKNFCHIRFSNESSVDAAIFLSGYRIRIGSVVDASNTGRLYVDYAHIYARDDQYEWECKQRQLQREQRHRERVEKERQRPPSSPPPIVHYTDYEASNICEKIKQDDTFMKAVQVVVTWLERGDCTKRNANTFYSMIQSTNSHVRRLLSEKVSYEEELQRAKELMKGRIQGLLIQFSQIERVFTAASHKKVWDHFTKAQRKNIEMWKKQSSEIKAVQLEETLMEGEGEMEVSDSEEEPQKKKSRLQHTTERNTDNSESGIQSLKEESESLRCQLEAYKNEVDLLKSETKLEIDNKNKQIKMLQQTLKGMQEQLMQSQKQQVQDDQTIRDLTTQLNASKIPEEPSSSENEVITLDKDDDINEESRVTRSMSGYVQVTQKDAKLIEPEIRPSEVEALMQRFPQVFKQELSGIGANMERRWQFSGFNICRPG
ncbi:ecto-NOX disulfide-thiol exchanger 2 isoform X2 [Chelonus insularis]|uniref:ecto-NOX disulfide-thiol exchanger 2 isoform X2 n=1 Tax=Chelonus insularis TaxID=460826 RepID=UPI00158F1BED|nr:ecto-NOX disulfide-thiol exchanger 2 isoform X2 [Chelonus insularis]